MVFAVDSRGYGAKRLDQIECPLALTKPAHKYNGICVRVVEIPPVRGNSIVEDLEASIRKMLFHGALDRVGEHKVHVDIVAYLLDLFLRVWTQARKNGSNSAA